MRYAEREGWDAGFTIYSRDEQKQALCRAKFPDALYVLGDVLDTERLNLAMYGHNYVIHAAALKYIPEGEFNASECVRINIDGARSVIAASRVAGDSRVVGISTDKAAQPINIYGMTKAVMERLFAEARISGGTVYTTCRYGNVVGSTGSVAPVMQDQFRKTGVVKITDPHMTRFWMRVDAAVETILAALDAPPGSVTAPDPRASTMYALAMAVLRSLGEGLADTVASDDPRIQVIGKRPGEKQHEDLLTHYELYRTRLSGEYYQLMPPGHEDYTHEMPSLSSDQAKRVDREELAQWITEAANV